MKNIDKLIEFLKAENVAFSMAHWSLTVDADERDEYIDDDDYGDKEADNFRGCGTIACIGGSAALIKEQELNPTAKFSELQDIGYRDAYEWIIEGMPHVDPSYDPEDLFEPNYDTAFFEASFGSDDYIERAKAIRVLEHFRDTGKIDWDL